MIFRQQGRKPTPSEPSGSRRRNGRTRIPLGAGVVSQRRGKRAARRENGQRCPGRNKHRCCGRGLAGKGRAFARGGAAIIRGLAARRGACLGGRCGERGSRSQRGRGHTEEQQKHCCVSHGLNLVPAEPKSNGSSLGFHRKSHATKARNGARMSRL